MWTLKVSRIRVFIAVNVVKSVENNHIILMFTIMNIAILRYKKITINYQEKMFIYDEINGFLTLFALKINKNTTEGLP